MSRSSKSKVSSSIVSDLLLTGGSAEKNLANDKYLEALVAKLDKDIIRKKLLSEDEWSYIELKHLSGLFIVFPLLFENFCDILDELHLEISDELSNIRIENLDDAMEANTIAARIWRIQQLQDSNPTELDAAIVASKGLIDRERENAEKLGDVFEGPLNREFAVAALKLAEKESPYSSQRRFIESLGVSRNVYRQCIAGEASIDQICKILEKAGRPLVASMPPSEPE